jgi:hypothetical protein
MTESAGSATAAATALVAAATLLAACGGPEVLERSDRSRIVQVVVEETERGLLDPAPAYAEAADVCGQSMRRAVFFRGEDLGSSRLLHFRCE